MKRLLVLFALLVIFGSLLAPLGAPVQATTNTYTITVQVDQTIRNISPLMLGSNLPAWLGQARFEDQDFRRRARHSGIKYLRIPGGSWSNFYGWLSCERRTYQVGNAHPCGEDGWDISSWIARPTDFINFLRAVNMKAIYVVNVNVSAQEAAALVAFFNGSVSDSRPIGIDRYGQDWKTVGYWAQLRADHGNPEPFYIEYWEIGNEVYGAKPSRAGSECVPWGWEDAWTCDGYEYVHGDSNHDGFLTIRNAMKAVDPSILVGAVGIEDVTMYNEWGRKVLREAGSAMDYYVIHPYPYGEPPTSWTEILAKPRQHWRDLRRTLNQAFQDYAAGRNIPIAANEFNLVYFHDLDYRRQMKTAGNMLFLAESIGQAIRHGYFMFNQWNLSNGCSQATGSCYDLLLADDHYTRTPQYFAFPLWARFGSSMLQSSSTAPAYMLSVYAGRRTQKQFTVLVINKTGQPRQALIRLSRGRIATASADVVKATSLNATTVTFNNLTNIPDNLATVPSLPVQVVNGRARYTFPPYSITLLRLNTP